LNLALFIVYLGGCVIAFNVAATAALVPSIAEEFAVSDFVIGRIIWAYMLPYGVTALFYGPLSRKIDIKKINAACFLAFFVFSFLSGLSQNFKQLFIARFLVGAVASCSTPLALIYIADSVNAEERGRRVGLFFGCTFASSILGLFLSGIINWRFIFLIPAIVGFVVSLLFMLYFPRQKARSQDFDMHYIKALSEKLVLRLFLYIFFISMLFHSVQQWLGVYFNEILHFPQFRISMLLTLVSVSGVFGEILGGLLSDRIGRIKTLKMGVFLMALSLFFLPTTSSFFILMFILLIWGFGWTVNHAGLSTSLTDLPSRYIPESSSLNSSVRFISGGLGVCIGGFFAERSFGFTFFSVAIVLMVLSFLSRIILAFSPRR